MTFRQEKFHLNRKPKKLRPCLWWIFGYSDCLHSDFFLIYKLTSSSETLDPKQIFGQILSFQFNTYGHKIVGSEGTEVLFLQHNFDSIGRIQYQIVVDNTSGADIHWRQVSFEQWVSIYLHAKIRMQWRKCSSR